MIIIDKLKQTALSSEINININPRKDRRRVGRP